jgi:predicted homoserine dehydrogenase-like protein
LKAGEILDGEGDSAVWGKLMPAEDSPKIGGLPIGLAYHVKLKRAISKAKHIGWPDIKIDETSEACRIERKMKDTFALSNTSPNDNH